MVRSRSFPRHVDTGAAQASEGHAGWTDGAELQCHLKRETLETPIVAVKKPPLNYYDTAASSGYGGTEVRLPQRDVLAGGPLAELFLASTSLGLRR